MSYNKNGLSGEAALSELRCVTAVFAADLVLVAAAVALLAAVAVVFDFAAAHPAGAGGDDDAAGLEQGPATVLGLLAAPVLEAAVVVVSAIVAPHLA